MHNGKFHIGGLIIFVLETDTEQTILRNCGGSLYSFNSKKEVMSFFESCINCSEGSERERYTIIYFDVKSNLNTNKRCFSDNTSFVYNSDIKVSEIDDTDEKLLIKKIPDVR